MTREFIYNIANIFGNSTDSLLSNTDTNRFYIGPYQRSYKWASENNDDQVPMLLSDIENSKTDGNTEYFLQYITVKIDTQKHWLEVIDGQQRLTTLSLLFYCLKASLNYENIAKDRVIYSRYNASNIFDDIINWVDNEPESNDATVDTQDFYYMVRAARKIINKIDFWKTQNSLFKDIINHILFNVKIIVNIENNFVSSEEIFANLNDNHVPLTDAYLIKGLLITNSVSRKNFYGRTLEYTEIQEKRQNLGREWDTILNWITKKERSHYFFKKTESYYDPQYAMEYLLKLAYRSIFRNEKLANIRIKEGHFALFNKFNDAIKSTDDAIKFMDALRHVFHKLRSIYDSSDSLIYNLLGYRLFCKNLTESNPFDLTELTSRSTAQQRDYLTSSVRPQIPDLSLSENSQNNYDRFRYKSQNPLLTNLLLSFSVFLPLMEDNNKKNGQCYESRFKFFEYDTAKWSFEHISPQNPKGKLKIPEYAREYIIKRINQKRQNSITNDENLMYDNLIDNIRNNQTIEVENIEFLYDNCIDEHSLGNMALLTQEDNSANNNNPFALKHFIILERKRKGAFIPNHTFEVFNKILLPGTNDKTFNVENLIWDQKDVDAHISYMEHENKMIIDWIKNLSK